MKLKTSFEMGSSPTAPLCLFIHGRAGHLDIMRIFIRSLPEGWHKLFVEAPYPDKIGGFSWWETGVAPFPMDQLLEGGNALLESIEEAIDANQITPKKTVGLGFSQGSGILSFLLLSGEIELDGLGILAGFVRWPGGDPVAPKAQIYWGHGENDEVIPYSRAEKDVETLKTLGYQVQFASDPVGHKVGSSGMRELKTFLASFN